MPPRWVDVRAWNSSSESLSRRMEPCGRISGPWLGAKTPRRGADARLGLFMRVS